MLSTDPAQEMLALSSAVIAGKSETWAQASRRIVPSISPQQPGSVDKTIQHTPWHWLNIPVNGDFAKILMPGNPDPLNQCHWGGTHASVLLLIIPQTLPHDLISIPHYNLFVALYATSVTAACLYSLSHCTVNHLTSRWMFCFVLFSYILFPLMLRTHQSSNILYIFK